MRAGALEAEAVALVQPEMALADPEIERPRNDDASLRSDVTIGLAAAGTRSDRAEQHLEGAVEVGRKKLVRDVEPGKAELLALARTDDDVALVAPHGRHRLEEIVERHAERLAD